jgi:hypothetical protein
MPRRNERITTVAYWNKRAAQEPATWVNADASAELLETLQSEVERLFKEVTGSDMPEGFKGWSFNNQGPNKAWRIGIAKEAAFKAVGKTMHDAAPELLAPEIDNYVRAWAVAIADKRGTIDDVDPMYRPHVLRLMTPTPARGLKMPPGHVTVTTPKTINLSLPQPVKGRGRSAKARDVA